MAFKEFYEKFLFIKKVRLSHFDTILIDMNIVIVATFPRRRNKQH